MSLFETWRQLCDKSDNTEEEVKMLQDYFSEEAEIYNTILNNKTDVIEGVFSDLAVKYGVSYNTFMGFMDGISESVKEELNLEAVEENSEVCIKIDWEKLYYNMLVAEANWLYELEGWNGILSPETRIAITKEYNKSRQVIKEVKIGRNDPCPCGSGKKYKKCCGK